MLCQSSHFNFFYFPVAVLLLVVFAPCPTLSGTTQVQYIRTILNPEPTTAAQMAARVRFISDTEVLLGARADSASGTNSGRSFLFDALSGVFLESFENPDPDSGDNFGLNGVSVGSNLIAISAHLNDSIVSDGGAVYVFKKDTGDLVNTLTSPNPTISGFFGVSLGSHGNNLLIGAAGDEVEGISSGAVYAMDPLTGDLIKTYRSPDPGDGDRFGTSLSHNANTILVGSDLNDDGELIDSGIAFAFDIQSGENLRTFGNPTPGKSDRFGVSLTISGDYAIIGAIKDDTLAEDSGAVYIFDLETGAFQEEIFSPEPEPFEDFGIVCDAGGSGIIVGAPASSFAGRFLEGRAYFFESSTWNHLATFTNPDASPDDYFGSGCDVSGDFCVIGSFGDDREGFNTGAALVFHLDQIESPSPTPTPISVPDDSGVVAGFVTDASDFEVIEQAILAMGDSIAYPNEEGIFIFDSVDLGLNTLDVVSPGYEPFSREINVGQATVLLVEILPKGTNPNADINFDGIVNQYDYLVVQKNWHNRFPSHIAPSQKDSIFDRRPELLQRLSDFLEENGMNGPQ